MITKIDLRNDSLVQVLFELQKASYLVEAQLINFFKIPPLLESMKELKECGETFLGYFDEDKLAGALSYTIEGEELTICRMVVHPDHFRKGIAQKLLTDAEENNKEWAVLKVSTGKENPPAKNLYLKNGYKLVGDLEIVPGLFISNFEKRRGGTMTTTFSHKQLAVNCFNAVWDLLDLNERTIEEEANMIDLAHTSFWHWTKTEDHTPKNLSIGYWQLSRVYATTGLGERALFYAERCLAVSIENKIEPFYIGYGYEAMSRANVLLGQQNLSKKHQQLAMEYAQTVENENEKEMLVKDLQSIVAE